MCYITILLQSRNPRFPGMGYICKHPRPWELQKWNLCLHHASEFMGRPGMAVMARHGFRIWVEVRVSLTSCSSFSKKRSSAGFDARGVLTTVRLVVRGEKATVP